MPLVHTAHTLAKVKNALLAAGDRPEPKARVIGEEQVVAEADRLVANTRVEARDLVDRYDADPARVAVVAARRRPGPVPARRRRPGRRRPRRPAPAGPARRRVRRRVRRPDPAAQGARRADPRGRRAARARPGARRRGDRGDLRRPERQRAGPADRADRAGRLARASPTGSGSCRRAPGTTCRPCTGPPTWSRCRRTTSRSGWSRWRRRPAARRWSPPPSAGWSPPSGTGSAGCWSTATTRPTGPGRWPGCCRTGPGAPRWPGAPRARPRLLLGPHRRRPARRLRRGDRRAPGPAGRRPGVRSGAHLLLVTGSPVAVAVRRRGRS